MNKKFERVLERLKLTIPLSEEEKHFTEQTKAMKIETEKITKETKNVCIHISN